MYKVEVIKALRKGRCSVIFQHLKAAKLFVLRNSYPAMVIESYSKRKKHDHCDCDGDGHLTVHQGNINQEHHIFSS